MNLTELSEILQSHLPSTWAEEWDNVGLMVGDPHKDITKIAVALDATARSVSRAAAQGCELLLVHHPAIFRPINRVAFGMPVPDMIATAIRRDVAIYSAHTNWDSAPNGVNTILSGLLGIASPLPIVPSGSGAWGMGAIGDLSKPMTMPELAARAKEVWGLSALLSYGDERRTLTRVALCGGAGGDLLNIVIERGADVYITADVSYHYLLDAQQRGINLIVVNHGEMERASLPNLCNLVRSATGLEVVLLENENWTPRII